MKKIAIIPARGGSKRIPRKNIRNFCGYPIIKYSIDAAIGSGCFDEVMVSTDDVEIAEISKKFGANVPFLRSPDLSNDTAMTAPVLLEVLKEYEKMGKIFDYACCIYPTAPFINAAKLNNALDIMIEKKANNAIPVVRFSYPIQRALQIVDGKLSMISPDNINVRSQDLSPAYHDSGQYYWLRVESFLENPTLFSDNTIAIELSEKEVQDIDTEKDWEMAELKYKLLNSM